MESKSTSGLVKGAKYLAFLSIVMLFSVLILGFVTYVIDDGGVISDVRITNVSSNSATVSWTTEEPSISRVFFAEGEGNWAPVFGKFTTDFLYDDRDTEQNEEGDYVLTEVGAIERYTHHVTIRDLDPETEYTFRIFGTTKLFDGGIDARFTTYQVQEDLNVPDPAYGRVVYQDSSQRDPIDGIVYFRLYEPNTDGEELSTSNFYSTTINLKSAWSADVGNLLDQSGDLYSFREGETYIELNVVTDIGKGGFSNVLEDYKPLRSVTVGLFDDLIDQEDNQSFYQNTIQNYFALNIDQSELSSINSIPNNLFPKLVAASCDGNPSGFSYCDSANTQKWYYCQDNGSWKDLGIRCTSPGKVSGEYSPNTSSSNNNASSQTQVQQSNRSCRCDNLRNPGEYACNGNSSYLCRCNTSTSHLVDANGWQFVSRCDSGCNASSGKCNAGSSVPEIANDPPVQTCESLGGVRISARSSTRPDGIVILEDIYNPERDSCYEMLELNCGKLVRCPVQNETRVGAGRQLGSGQRCENGLSQHRCSDGRTMCIDTRTQTGSQACGERQNTVRCPAGQIMLSNCVGKPINSNITHNNRNYRCSGTNVVINNSSGAQVQCATDLGPVQTQRENIREVSVRDPFVRSKFLSIGQIAFNGSTTFSAQLSAEVVFNNLHTPSFTGRFSCSKGGVTVGRTTAAAFTKPDATSKTWIYTATWTDNANTSQGIDRCTFTYSNKEPVEMGYTGPIPEINNGQSNNQQQQIEQDDTPRLVSKDDKVNVQNLTQNNGVSRANLSYSFIVNDQNEVRGSFRCSNGSINSTNWSSNRVQGTSQRRWQFTANWIVESLSVPLGCTFNFDSNQGLGYEDEFKRDFYYSDKTNQLRSKIISSSIAQDTNILDIGTYQVQISDFSIELQIVNDNTRVIFFDDQNGDGIRQDNEPEVERETLKIQINKEKDIVSYSLIEGWNLIGLEMVSQDWTRASELIEEINSLGSENTVTHIATFEGGSWKMYSQRLDEGGNVAQFGQDFTLLPGQGYFVRSNERIVINLEGNKFAENVPIDMVNGWNLISLQGPSLNYRAETFLDRCSNVGLSCDSLSRYDSGLYQSVVKDNGILFGNDFNLISREGYFVRVNDGGPQRLDL